MNALSVEDAHTVTGEIRRALAQVAAAVTDLARRVRRAHRGRAQAVPGYPTRAAYVQGEFGGWREDSGADASHSVCTRTGARDGTDNRS